ncbi:MAG TPA: hypothetical protein VFY95_00190 [Sphingomicrobium sp.]
MNAYTTGIEARAIRATREQVAGLLARYPNVSTQDSRTILDFLRTGRHLDVGLLTANDKLKPNLDAFMRDHQAHFRVKIGEGAAVIAGIAALLAILWLIWEAFA